MLVEQTVADRVSVFPISFSSCSDFDYDSFRAFASRLAASSDPLPLFSRHLRQGLAASQVFVFSSVVLRADWGRLVCSWSCGALQRNVGVGLAAFQAASLPSPDESAGE